MDKKPNPYAKKPADKPGKGAPPAKKGFVPFQKKTGKPC